MPLQISCVFKLLQKPVSVDSVGSWDLVVVFTYKRDVIVFSVQIYNYLCSYFIKVGETYDFIFMIYVLNKICVRHYVFHVIKLIIIFFVMIMF